MPQKLTRERLEEIKRIYNDSTETNLHVILDRIKTILEELLSHAEATIGSDDASIPRSVVDAYADGYRAGKISVEHAPPVSPLPSRAEIAMRIMAALYTPTDGFDRWTKEQTAKLAVDGADALLAELAKTK